MYRIKKEHCKIRLIINNFQYINVRKSGEIIFTRKTVLHIVDVRKTPESTTLIYDVLRFNLFFTPFKCSLKVRALLILTPRYM